ncbi:MAG: hypothetical protein HY328_10680 [Chloroflexi bacterium]|nr:hypothetical protein [Chloroflexota bacterium]
MSKKHTSVVISSNAQKAARPQWLLPGALAVAALAVVALVIWFAQGRQITATFEPEVTGQPKAVIDQTAFDYGNVKLNRTIETVFRVKNVGGQALVFQGEPIVEVVEGC